MARHNGRESMLIEARNQLGDGIAGAATSSLGRSAVALSSSNSKERFGAGNVAGRLGVCASEAFERALFLRRKQRSGSFWRRVMRSLSAPSMNMCVT